MIWLMNWRKLTSRLQTRKVSPTIPVSMSKSSRWVMLTAWMEIFLTKTRTEDRFHPDRSFFQIPNLTFTALPLSYAFFIIVFIYKMMPLGRISRWWIIKVALIEPSGAVIRTPQWLVGLYSNPWWPALWSIQQSATHTHEHANPHSL